MVYKATFVGTVLNTMKTVFYLIFFISNKPSNSMDTQKHGNNKKLSINSFSLFTSKIVIWKKLAKKSKLK